MKKVLRGENTGRKSCRWQIHKYVRWKETLFKLEGFLSILSERNFMITKHMSEVFAGVAKDFIFIFEVVQEITKS